MSNVAQNTLMYAQAGPIGGPLNGGHWNDADMLQVGNLGFTIAEQRSHFGLWCLMASPLLIGTDISLLTNSSLTILGNAEVTAINQDPLGVQGIPIPSQLSKPDQASCWTKPLQDGSVAVILLNLQDNSADVTCKLSDLGIKAGAKNIRDLWNHKDLGTPDYSTGILIVKRLEAHDHAFYKVTY